MPTKTRTKPRHRPARPLRGSMTDCTTLRNPYARPRRIWRRPGVTNLPPVVERPEEYAMVRILHERGELLAWDNMAVWELTYRCLYYDGREDVEVDVRQVIAATRAKAITILQQLLVGFGVAQIVLYHVRPPLTREQVADINAVNAELELERKRAGYGMRTNQQPQMNTDEHRWEPTTEL